MTTLPRLLALAALAAGLSTAQATNSRPELESVLQDLLQWWPGEYDTFPQVALERQYGAPPDGEHDRQYREFARVDVPHLGANVIYGEVRTGGRDGPLIKGQQVMYLITIDEANQAVNVSGRRIQGGAEFERVHRNPAKLASVRLDENYGGNCDFRFRRYGPVLRGWLTEVGRNNETCTMTSRLSGQTMTWDADWMIGPQEIWIFDNGYLRDPEKPNERGRLFAGREDLTPERLYKMRDFRCRASGNAGPSGPTIVHDRGGEFPVTLAGGAKALARLTRMPLETGQPARLVDGLRLALYEKPDSPTPLASARADGSAPRVSLGHAGTTLACEVAR